MRLINNDTVLQCEPKHPEGVVIWLHGLGASSTDLFEGLWQATPLTLQQRYRAIFLQAPDRPISINGGMVMPAWFDIYGLSDQVPVDSDGLMQSMQIVQEYIAEQAADQQVNNRIIIAGFSQGGALALHAGLRAAHPISQIHVFSGYVPLREALIDDTKRHNQSCQVHFYHGMTDDIVPESYMLDGATYLRSKAIDVSYSRFFIGHMLSPECLQSFVDRIGH